MKEISTTDIRKDFSEALNQVAYNKERLTVNRHGKKVAAIVPLEDLEFLERLEEESDLRAARAAMKEKGENIPWEQAKRELGLEK